MDQKRKVFIANFHEIWGEDKNKIFISKYARISMNPETKKKVLISKTARISTKSGTKTKKKVFVSLYARISTNSGVKPQKKGLYCKICEKTVLAHEFCGDNQYFGSFRPQTPLQWHRACYFLWGTILAWGGISSDLGARPRNAPRRAGPALLRCLFARKVNYVHYSTCVVYFH